MEMIHTIDDLEQALQGNTRLIDHYQSLITIQADLETYQQTLIDDGRDTKVISNLGRWPVRAKGIHPSSACKKGVCLLKLYYECTHEITPLKQTEPRTHRIWDIGTFLHDIHQTWLHEMYGDQFRSEVHLTIPEFKVSSHTDGLFTFSKYSFMLEMKSIKEGGNFGWDKVQLKPFDDNVRQLHFYMKAANVPFGLIFYINKNTSAYKEHPIVFDFKLWDELTSEVCGPVAEAAFDGAKVPDGSPGFGCKWCDFSHACPERRKEQGHDRSSGHAW